MKKHLAQEQFSSLLLGDVSDARVLRHVEACESCQSEMKAFRTAVSDYNSIGASWAVRKSTELRSAPGRRQAQDVTWVSRAPLFSGALIVCLLLALWVFRKVSINHPAAALGLSASATEVERDNQWLLPMYAELQAAPESIVTSPSQSGTPGEPRNPRQQREDVR